MATIGNTFPTILDVAKRLDPDGAIPIIAEQLSKYNPILQDIPWMEGNLPTGHRFTARNGLPSMTWRRFNEGIDGTKSTTAQYDEQCGLLEAISKVDVQLAKLNGNEAAFRASEDMSFIQAMNIEVASGLFYHSTKVNPERFEGFTPRLDVTAGNPASSQIIKVDASASGANQTSIWLVGWSENTAFGIYPKGTKGGIDHQDMGEQLALDSNNKQFRAYVTDWVWKVGLCVKDYRFVVRLCNIDVNRISAVSPFNSDLALAMLDGIAAMYSLEGVRPVFYMSRKAFNFLNKQLVSRQANWLEWLTVDNGVRIPMFMGIPIRYLDAVVNTESVVT